MSNQPKYRPNQVVKILHHWAQAIPPRPVENVSWDECLNCYTYALPLIALLRIEEHQLEETDKPDITPEAWIEQYLASQVRP